MSLLLQHLPISMFNVLIAAAVTVIIVITVTTASTVTTVLTVTNGKTVNLCTVNYHLSLLKYGTRGALESSSKQA